MHEIIKYPVQHPSLKRYIRFFWSLQIAHIQLNNKFIPQKNINMRFNLSETPQYIHLNGRESLLEDIFFSGMQDHCMNASMRLNGKVDIIGICFFPDGFYPFLRTPVSEFKNQVLGTNEIGFKPAKEIIYRLKEKSTTAERIIILEHWLIKLLDYNDTTTESFQKLFNLFQQNGSILRLSKFCQKNNISPRTLERLYNKHVGISAKSFITLNRFQNSLNNLLYTLPSRLSNIAYSNGYFDQMHFIKDFKRFTGNSPGVFIRNNNSMLQIGRLK